MTAFEILANALMIALPTSALGWFIARSVLFDPILRKIGERWHSDLVEHEDQMGEVFKVTFHDPKSEKVRWAWKLITCPICIAWQASFVITSVRAVHAGLTDATFHHPIFTLAAAFGACIFILK